MTKYSKYNVHKGGKVKDEECQRCVFEHFAGKPPRGGSEHKKRPLSKKLETNWKIKFLQLLFGYAYRSEGDGPANLKDCQILPGGRL